jgi:hypothetical protein
MFGAFYFPLIPEIFVLALSAALPKYFCYELSRKKPVLNCSGRQRLKFFSTAACRVKKNFALLPTAFNIFKHCRR